MSNPGKETENELKVIHRKEESGAKKHSAWLSGLFPFTFIMIIWLIHLAQLYLSIDLRGYSTHPRTATGLIGIVSSPLLHSGWEHLVGNTIPLLVLSTLLFVTYREIAMKVFLYTYFLHGVLLWSFANDGYHLGASGMIYGIASFLFFSGFVRKNPPLAVISFLVVFLYGYMAHGIFPIYPHVSWEGHLYGALTGMMLAFVLKKEGPQAKKYFEDETDEEEVQNHQQMHDEIPPHHDQPYVPSDPLFPQQGWIQWEWKQTHTGEKKEEDRVDSKEDGKE